MKKILFPKLRKSFEKLSELRKKNHPVQAMQSKKIIIKFNIIDKLGWLRLMAKPF